MYDLATIKAMNTPRVITEKTRIEKIAYCLDIDMQNLYILEDFNSKEELQAFYDKCSDDMVDKLYKEYHG